jgi:hypothetical protein
MKSTPRFRFVAFDPQRLVKDTTFNLLLEDLFRRRALQMPNAVLAELIPDELDLERHSLTCGSSLNRFMGVR